MRRLAAFTIFALLLTIAVAASAWTVEDCEEVNYDHPDCDQYPTTTTYQTTTTQEVTTTTTVEVTTTTAEVTTTTEPEVTTTQPETTTTTPNETTTTVGQQETTTTTAAPCEEGLDHQPPLCVDLFTTTLAPTETVPAPTTPAGEETLPFTGSDAGMLAVAALSLLVLGGAMVRKSIG